MFMAEDLNMVNYVTDHARAQMKRLSQE
jgi:hypothetical protein